MSHDSAFKGSQGVTTESGGKALWSVGALVVVKVDGTQTDGAFSFMEHTAPAGWESPYHVHEGVDEMFYILEGEMECYSGDDGEEVLHAGPGETMFLPRDVPHGFRVVGDDDCRMLIQVAPSGLEEFFAEVGVPAERMETPPPAEPDVAMLTAVAKDYRLEILGPLPK
ncbi:cupin domain-containing protein [Halogeometricum limi]|uniref:Cupin domain-containing protein n=1 Tax=Halogeometricum limi TaxID=555875 RepID=A0A1I6HCV1_9EURY|nr:cupin domain-containing protein [Halogeometricum limi]SFR52180.1 Cupin domain-containing protein [Halogeometricum limi]